MDGISAGRALRAASVNDLIMVPQKHVTNSSIAGKNLSGVRHHTIAAFCRRRCTSSADRIAAYVARTMEQTQRRTTKCPLRTYRRHVKNFFTKKANDDAFLTFEIASSFCLQRFCTKLLCTKSRITRRQFHTFSRLSIVGILTFSRITA